jgi:TNF receptor-associated factor 3
MDQLDRHFEENVQAHTSLLNDGCVLTQQSVQQLSLSVEKQLKSCKETLDEDEKERETITQRVTEVEGKMSGIAAQVKINQQHTLELCYQSVDGAQKHMKEKTDAVEEVTRMITEKLLKMEEVISMQTARIHQLETGLTQKMQSSRSQASHATQEQFSAQDRVLATHDIKLAEHSLRLDMMDCKNTDGVLLWKITEIRRRRRDAVSGKTPSIYSQPFYTSMSGYKMCARLYLNGDGMGRGTHLSLFFVVMRGEYDSLLPWPFQHKVTLVLIDQEGQRHISDTFRPDPSSSSFMKPRNEMNVASGCPLFVSLSTLDSGGYIRDDCLFIKIVVDTANVSRPEAR